MAAELKIIPTITETNLVGSDISIKTSYYKDLLPDTIEAQIANSVGSKNGTVYTNGELIITTKNSPQNLNYLIDGDGHLILVINTGDGLKYSVNSSGHLIYTKD